MISYLTRRLLGPSAARRKRRVSLWVLVWICLSQFPLPVAHAHADFAANDSQLASHIESKHPSGEDDTSCLHWHLVMPWETGEHEDEDKPTHHPSPLGLWGAEGNVLPHSQSITVPPLTTLEWVAFDSRDTWAQNLGLPGGERVPAKAANFTQTYLGVPLCTLVCVSLR